MSCDLNESTLSNLFECAIVNEMKAADIFAGLSEDYSHIPEIKEFWNEMHDDEIMHAEVLKKIHNELPPERLNEAADHFVCEYVERAYQLLVRISNDEPANLNEAYELVHELEFSELNEAYMILIKHRVGTETSKDFIKEEIKTHQKKMVDFKDIYGDKKWRLGILPKSK